MIRNVKNSSQILKLIRELRWPLVSKLLAGSLVLHLLFVASVLYIPGVRDAFNLASLIADTRFVDKAYDRTEIGDDVQLVELTSEKFHYPEGYFAAEGAVTMPSPTPLPFLAEALKPAPVQPEIASSSPSPSPFATPSTAASAVSSSPAVAQAKASPSPTGSPAMTADEAQTALDKTAAENNLNLQREQRLTRRQERLLPFTLSA